VPGRGLGGKRRVASVSPVPVMLDEPICELADVKRASAIANVGFCKLKLKRFGGLDLLREARDVLFTLLLAFLGRAGEQSELARDQAGGAIPPHDRRAAPIETPASRAGKSAKGDAFAVRPRDMMLYREEFSEAVKRSGLKYKSHQVRWRQWGGERPAGMWHLPSLRGRSCRNRLILDTRARARVIFNVPVFHRN
jgi:hypothetical protein